MWRERNKNIASVYHHSSVVLNLKYYVVTISFISTRENPVVDTQKIKTRESSCMTIKIHQISKEDINRWWREQNNNKNSQKTTKKLAIASLYYHITKHKWIKFSSQKIWNGWIDKKSIFNDILPIRDSH